MAPTFSSQSELPDSLQDIARTAGDELRATSEQNDEALASARREKHEAASHAMSDGHDFGSIAAAEKLGRDDARRLIGGDLLKRVTKAAQRRQAADREYRDAVRRAVAVGLGHREVGEAAGVSHATIRAIAEKRDGQPMDDAPDTGAEAA